MNTILLVLAIPALIGFIFGAGWGYRKGVAKANDISWLRDVPAIRSLEHEAFQNGYDAAKRDRKDELQELREIKEELGFDDIDEAPMIT